MRNIKVKDLQDLEKSQIFTMLMGRLVEDPKSPSAPRGLRTWKPFEGGKPGDAWNEFPVPNFYKLRHMEYAWRVGNWAEKQKYANPYNPERPDDPANFWGWDLMDLSDFDTPPEIAVRQWLDKILELAIVDNRIDWQKLPFANSTTA